MMVNPMLSGSCYCGNVRYQSEGEIHDFCRSAPLFPEGLPA